MSQLRQIAPFPGKVPVGQLEAKRRFLALSPDCFLSKWLEPQGSFLLLVAMPGAPSSVLAPSSDGLHPRNASLLLVVRPLVASCY